MFSIFLSVFLAIIGIVAGVVIYLMYYCYTNKPSMSLIFSRIKKTLKSKPHQTLDKDPAIELLRLMMGPILQFLDKLPYRSEYCSKLRAGCNYDIRIRDQIFYNYTLIKTSKVDNSDNSHKDTTYMFIGIVNEVIQL